MDILDRLVADHERLRQLLQLFERELSAFEHDEAGDLQLMADIVGYYSQYFNGLHHPLEEYLFERLSLYPASQDTAPEVDVADHALLAEATHRLGSLLDEALNGGLCLRADLVSCGHRFVEHNLAHMRHEEQGSFRLARQHLGDRDWSAVEQRVLAKDNQAEIELGRQQYAALIESLSRSTTA